MIERNISLARQVRRGHRAVTTSCVWATAGTGGYTGLTSPRPASGRE